MQANIQRITGGPTSNYQIWAEMCAPTRNRARKIPRSRNFSNFSPRFGMTVYQIGASSLLRPQKTSRSGCWGRFTMCLSIGCSPRMRRSLEKCALTLIANLLFTNFQSGVYFLSWILWKNRKKASQSRSTIRRHCWSTAAATALRMMQTSCLTYHRPMRWYPPRQMGALRKHEKYQKNSSSLCCRSTRKNISSEQQHHQREWRFAAIS